MENKDILFFELEENRNKQVELKDELNHMIKGHVNILYRNGKGYYYLTYRDGNKINNDYLGPVEKSDLTDTFNKLRIREEYKKELKQLKIREKEIKKEIKAKKKNDS